MKYKKILLSVIGVASVISPLFTSCNYLDTDNYFQAIYKEDSIFHSQVNAEGYLWNTPQNFPSAGNIWGNSWTPGETASDEICVRWRTAEFWGAQFTTNNINEQNVPNWGLWHNMYNIIQRCNKMFANIDNVSDMDADEKREYRSYAHFMRGYAYYLLLMNWGPCLIVGDELISTSQPAEYYDRERSTFDESVDYICNEFAQALPGLKTPSQLSLAYFGRPTKGVALALIARLRLYQASPTFNGGALARRAFGEWKRQSDGAFYVNQTYDPKRWAVAAAAAKQVIDLDYYNLFTVERDKDNPFPVDKSVASKNFPEGAADIDPYRSYTDMFNGEGEAKVNREFIWAEQSSSAVLSYTRHSFPSHYGGWGGMSVPQRVVDCFYMQDGKLPSESSLYEADLTKAISSQKTIGSVTLAAGTPKMYENRSARFYANIGFPGRVWPMTSCTEGGYFNQTFWMSNDDNSGKSGAGNNVNDFCITGYVPYKYIHPDDSWANKTGASRMAKPFPIIRYGEVLLEYVEALNHVANAENVQTWDLNGNLIDVNINRNVADMKRYFNMIRFRVGLPGVSDETLQDENAFDVVLKNERQVELFNEGYRYFDTRRWGTFIETDASSSWRGLDVTKDRSNSNGNGGFWNIVNINEQNIRDRVATPRMVFLPLAHSELLKSPKMDQNPGYDR